MVKNNFSNNGAFSIKHTRQPKSWSAECRQRGCGSKKLEWRQ
jgi:hypothetical protein